VARDDDQVDQGLGVVAVLRESLCAKNQGRGRGEWACFPSKQKSGAEQR
jgi:hypothetical protein